LPPPEFQHGSGRRPARKPNSEKAESKTRWTIGGFEYLAANKKSRLRVNDGEGIALAAVPSAEVPFEIHAPGGMGHQQKAAS
jgi:hypothetical protein